jgi:hypothetical protein
VRDLLDGHATIAGARAVGPNPTARERRRSPDGAPCRTTGRCLQQEASGTRQQGWGRRYTTSSPFSLTTRAALHPVGIQWLGSYCDGAAVLLTAATDVDARRVIVPKCDRQSPLVPLRLPEELRERVVHQRLAGLHAPTGAEKG